MVRLPNFFKLALGTGLFAAAVMVTLPLLLVLVSLVVVLLVELLLLLLLLLLLPDWPLSPLLTVGTSDCFEIMRVNCCMFIFKAEFFRWPV